MSMIGSGTQLSEQTLGSHTFSIKKVGEGVELQVVGPNANVLIPTDRTSLKSLGEFLVMQATHAEKLPVAQTEEPQGNVAAVVQGVHKVAARTTSSMLDDDPAGGLVAPRHYTTPTTGGY
jgi:hypothetical protein